MSATSADSFGQMAQQALEARAVSNTNWSGHNSESYGRFDAIIRSVGVCEPQVVGEDHGLNSVAGANFLQYPADVGLDCGFG
jgi:hypothetical protein